MTATVSTLPALDPQTSTRSPRALLVCRDEVFLDSLARAADEEGCTPSPARSLTHALNALLAEDIHIVVAALDCDRADLFDLLARVRSASPDVVSVVLAPCPALPDAVQAVKLGADDYLALPLRPADLRRAIRNALARHRQLAEARRLDTGLAGAHAAGPVVGTDPSMARVFELVEAVADSSATVLITGESGTGKSLIARALHARSARRAGPFVEVSCGALPETLLESELFGHVRGSFTGATADKPGRFSAAAGGTIFLDEIAVASPALQLKLLRVLQDRAFEPVGSNKTHLSDARVLLATNVDLSAEVSAGRFRQDLFYRVNVFNIPLPALRERPGDIPLLARFFLEAALRRQLAPAGRGIRGFARDTLDLLARYDWPGNVRELENCVERAVVLARGPLITPDDLPDPLRLPSVSLPPSPQESLAAALDRCEADILRQTLASCSGNRSAAARRLGIDRTTLYKKLRRLGLAD